MGIGVFIHHCGTALLLVATGLLIVADVSAPVTHELSLLHVKGSGREEILFGTFGWCVTHLSGGGDLCSRTRVGYNPFTAITDAGITISYSDAAKDSAKALTYVMVLHAVATGISFIAFLLSVGLSCIGSLFSAFAALLAFIITLIVVICDFIAWSIVKHEVNSNSASTTTVTASYGSAIWCVLAAAVCTLLAAIFVFVTCCAGKFRDRHRAGRDMNSKY